MNKDIKGYHEAKLVENFSKIKKESLQLRLQKNVCSRYGQSVWILQF